MFELKCSNMSMGKGAYFKSRNETQYGKSVVDSLTCDVQLES